MDKEIIDLYLSGMSSCKIAKQLNISVGKIFYILKKNQIKTRSNKTNYQTICINNFQNITTELEAYLLGILITDGQVQHPKQSSKLCRLDLLEQDKKILEYLKQYLGVSNKIHLYDTPNKKNKMARISIYSDKLCENLAHWGVVPNKTFLTVFPNISPSLYRHFIRGCSDGDGCITYDCWKLSGTITLLTAVQNQLINQCGFNKIKIYQRHKDRNNNIRSLEYGGKKQLAKLYTYLYKDAHFFMQRKKDKMYEKANKYL